MIYIERQTFIPEREERERVPLTRQIYHLALASASNEKSLLGRFNFSPALYVQEKNFQKMSSCRMRASHYFTIFSEFFIMTRTCDAVSSRHGFIFPLLLEHHLSRFFMKCAEDERKWYKLWGINLEREAK
jgi:hypothetical protein